MSGKKPCWGTNTWRPMNVFTFLLFKEEDEDNGLEYTLEPLVKLERIEHKTGEEEDEIIFQK